MLLLTTRIKNLVYRYDTKIKYVWMIFSIRARVELQYTGMCEDYDFNMNLR